MICRSLPGPNITPAVPPIKCQDTKTKLARFILANIRWDGVVVRAISHLYHEGSTESPRNVMEEALLIR